MAKVGGKIQLRSGAAGGSAFADDAAAPAVDTHTARGVDFMIVARMGTAKKLYIRFYAAAILDIATATPGSDPLAPRDAVTAAAVGSAIENADWHAMTVINPATGQPKVIEFQFTASDSQDLSFPAAPAARYIQPRMRESGSTTGSAPAEVSVVAQKRFYV